jgi:DNA-binding response OmpR family regulator
LRGSGDGRGGATFVSGPVLATKLAALMSHVPTALIVEDDPLLRTAMSKVLGRMAFRVISASHFDGATSLLTALEVNLVCISACLPSKSGYDLCEHIRGPLGLGKLPILFVCRRANAWDMAYAEDVGGNALLRKPFTMGQFTHSVKFLLDPVGCGVSPMRELQPLIPMSAQPATNRVAEAPALVAA